MEAREETAGETTFGNLPDTCPICMDVYKKPKLLPCGHTICQICLENIIASMYHKNVLICPICRKENQVPEDGPKHFMPNYFIPATKTVLICDVCEIPLSDFEKDKRCSYCGGNMCLECFKKHHHPQNELRKFQRLASQEDEPDDGLAMDGSHRVTMHNLMMQLQGRAQSLYTGNIVSVFQCEQQSRQPLKVLKIEPTSDNKLWIILENFPFVIKYNSAGMELERKYVDGTLIDIAIHKEGFLLMVLDNYFSVMSFEDTAQITEYVSTTDSLSPRRILVLPNGFLLVAAVRVMAAARQQESVILVYNLNREVVDTIQCHRRDIPFGSVVSLSSNIKYGQVCIADEAYQSIFMLRQGAAPLTYTRQGGFPTRNRGGHILDERYRGFRPKSLTCDKEGNVFAYDDSSGMIHVLNSSARLLGLILTNDEELSGNPNCLAMDSLGRLLVGDQTSGKVRIYEVNAWYNNVGLQTEGDAGAFFESMRQHLEGASGIQDLVDISHRINVNPDMFVNAVLNHHGQQQ